MLKVLHKLLEPLVRLPHQLELVLYLLDIELLLVLGHDVLFDGASHHLASQHILFFTPRLVDTLHQFAIIGQYTTHQHRLDVVEGEELGLHILRLRSQMLLSILYNWRNDLRIARIVGGE